MDAARRALLGAAALGATGLALMQNYLLANNFTGVPESTIGKMKQT